MTNKLLYAITVPTDVQTRTASDRRKELSKQGVLASDVAATESIAPQPGEQALSGQVHGQFAPLIATMLEELFSSSIETVPFAARSGTGATDGYYALDQLGTDLPDGRSERVQSFDGTLTFIGTDRSFWRAVATTVNTIDTPFGSDNTPEFGLSIRAEKVQWYDAATGSTESATVQRTVDGEHDQLDIYDASEPSFADPTLIYAIDYLDEYPTDCTVWDTYDRSKVYRESGTSATVGSATVGSATVGGDDLVVDSQWQRVFATDHEWRGDIVMETDRLRLWVDQPADTLRAYRYDPSDGQYTLVQLGSSDWRLWDINVSHIGLARLAARCTFEDTSGNRYTLVAHLLRGREDVIFEEPANAGATPAGLVDRLAPIAATTDQIAVPAATTVKKSEVQ